MTKAITKTTTIDERYQAGVKSINQALKKYHPDTNGASETNERMTRKLNKTKSRWTFWYKVLKSQDEQ